MINQHIPCNPSPECKYFGHCFEDVDHIYWPRRNYKTSIERSFRELDENKQVICRALHDERHATEQPPKKPSRDEMLQAIAARVIQEAS